MKDQRPDPDDLLKVVKDETHRSKRGQLKIFFGACAGVGKTFAMLQAARQLQAEGVAVGIGIVETHGRKDTQELTEGLPVLPRRTMSGNGKPTTEFDLDGALVAEYRLLIVDELAHTNVAGSRHAKRWQDVEELLDAGIDVYSALNVQHLDNLNDIVGGIIGVRMRETVPDRIFDAATDVVLVDLPPDDLLARMNAGKVYLPVSIERARQNFFRRGNLIALRELALRRVADRVNSDVRTYRVSHAIKTVWPTQELLMVCVGADRSQEKLVREGARLAQRLQAKWIVVHVDRPYHGDDTRARETLLRIASFAQVAGAEFANVPGQDIAATLLDYARKRNATKLILGHPAGRRFAPFRPRLQERIARADPAVSLILLSVDDIRPAIKRTVTDEPQGYVRSLAIATLACGVTIAAAAWLLRVFDLSNVVMLFLMTVVVVAMQLGRLAGAWAALLCVVCFDFFFVEPSYSFTVNDTQYLFTFALMLGVALIISQLTARMRSEAKVARAGEGHARALAHITRDLSSAIKLEQIVTICRENITPLFGADVALLVPDLKDRLVASREASFIDLSIAQWSFEHNQEAGLGTQTLSAATALYLPLKASMATRGVLAIKPGDAPPSRNPDDRRLLDACCSSIALVLERIHFVEVAQDTLVRMEGEKLRNALLSAVSHDLKTPLTAIRGLAETLECTKELPEEDRSDLARSIRVQADELKRLVSNLLDLARMQSEGVHLNKEWHSLSEIVGSALAQSAALLKPRAIRTTLPADLPLVEVDAALIERVLINLFDNAAKYTPSTSTISVRGGASGDSMYLVIEDDGPGLPATDPDLLFEPFMRGQKDLRSPGLASVWHSAEASSRLMGGVSGRKRASRTVLPLKSSWRSAPLPKLKARLGMIKPRILIVEDEADIRRFVRMALEKEGMNVFETATAEEARLNAGSRKPDLMIVDLGLPDGDGKALIREVRSWLSAPILVLSAREREAEKVEALDAGADDYLSKPFGVSELLARVRAQLRRSSTVTNGATSSPAVKFGQVTINLSTHEVTRAGQSVHLTPNEFRLLTALIRGHGKVLTHRQLLMDVWGPGYAERFHYIRIYMAQLRQKLEDDPSQPVHLITELQAGYRLSGLEIPEGN